MGLSHSPSIVMNGLVSHVDAGNGRCYPGSGLGATGLVGSVGCTLNGGVGFSSGNLGNFIFDGSNDYLDFGNSSSVQLFNGTISAWVKTSAPGGGFRGIMAKQNAYGLFYSDSVLVAYDWGAGGGTRSTGINIADGAWKNVVMTFQSAVSNGTRIYINGSLALTTTMTWLNDTQSLYGGAEVSANQYAACSGSIFSLYNRPLSASEVLQNYNASKRRFGLS
jgi:hypothetical protein